MIELPLFPLNTVLFPGMPLNLHIFQERYKLLINNCIEKREPFGVVLIANDVSDTNPLAEPHLIGCTAQITQVQPLGEGRMNISAVGRERFQIISLQHEKPYMMGMIEFLPLIDDEPEAVASSAAKLRTRVKRYLQQLEQAQLIQLQNAKLPDDTLTLAYLAAVLLQHVSTDEKQKLLASERALTLITDLCSFYRRELTMLKIVLANPREADYKGLFSLN